MCKYLTKRSADCIIKMPASQAGQKALLHMAVSSPIEPLRDSEKGEVMRMWKWKLLKAVLIVIFAVLTVALLTTNAC